MRNPFPEETESYRDRRPGTPYESNVGDQYGSFYVKTPSGVRLVVLVSSGNDWADGGLPGEPWEHVSVSTSTRCPTWEEMSFVKHLFFKDEECVVQFHPPKKDHISFHDYCLHLWRCPSVNFPMPPKECIA